MGTKRFSISLILLVFLITPITFISFPSQIIAQTSFTHPNMYLNQSEIDAIKAKVAANQEPWKSAYNKLIQDANAALNMTPKSVVDDGGGHFWRTDHPYLTDGVYDPDAHRNDYINGDDMSDAMRDLALAYKMTGNESYANKSVTLLCHWFINPTTYMEPDPANKGPATPGHESGGSIEIYISLPAAFYAADLLWDYSGFNASCPGQSSGTVKTGLQTWASTALSKLPQTSNGNNWDNWLTLFRMSMTVVKEDQAILTTAFNRWKSLVSSQVRSDGLLQKELGRTRSLDYSMFSLNPMTQGAEIARHHGEDLYSYTTTDGKNLEKVFDAYQPYVMNPATWPYEQISAFTGIDGVHAYEMANLYKQKPEYLQVINKYKRPLIDIWTQGPITLTHASGAYPFQMLNPTYVSTPVISPASTSFTDSITITMTDSTPGAEIRYTTNGATPTQSSSLYSAPFTLIDTTTVKAIAYAPDLDPSALASATYTKVATLGPVIASSYQSDASGSYPPENTIDHDYATRWSAQGDGQWIQFDLGQQVTVDKILIAWYNGSQRRSTFDILTSDNAASWTTILSNHSSSGTTDLLETYDITDTGARHVRILGHGNSINDWNSITEIAMVTTGGTITPSPTSSAPTPTNTPVPPTPTPTPGTGITLPAPYAFYTFDEGTGDIFADSSGQNFEGQLSNTSWIEGKANYGTALRFPGTIPDQEYGIIPQFDLPANTTKLTITAWVNPSQFTGTYEDNRIISKAVGTGEQDHFFMLSGIKSGSNTYLRFRLKTGSDPLSGTTTLIASSGDLTENTWHHITAVYDGSTMILYKNGVEVGRVAKTAAITSSTSVATLIGLNPTSPDPLAEGGYGGWRGMIDDLRIYTESLNPSQIQSVMTSPNQNQPISPKLGDTNGDGHVNILDLSSFLSSFGGSYLSADFDGDGDIDMSDLAILLTNFGM